MVDLMLLNKKINWLLREATIYSGMRWDSALPDE